MTITSKHIIHPTTYRLLLNLVACILIHTCVIAQDIHFSQFYTTPILTNPANTGMSGEGFRVANNYRNQWGRIGVPFKTFYTSIDKKVTVANQSFGIGGSVVHDQSAYNLNADEFLLSFSYSKIINNHQFTAGIQPGFAFKSFNANSVTFGSQFDPFILKFNPDLPSSENNLNSNLRYFDMNVGIYWRSLIRNMMPMAGFTVSHILKPVVTFSNSGKTTRLPMKLTFYGQLNIPLSTRIDITPSMLYSAVPGANEFLLGSLEGFSINDFFIPVKKIYAITLFRLNPFRNIDAMILGGGVKFAKFDLGITYDINISPLSRASYFNGAFEVSLIFTGGGHNKKNSNEPCYIY